MWVYSGGKATWYFITVPKKDSKLIKANSGKRKGWGSVPVKVTIGGTTWKTSVFPYSEENAYILPVKADVRKKEGLREGSAVDATLQIALDV